MFGAGIKFKGKILALAMMATVGPLVGCASPAGRVFPVLDQPRVWPAPPATARIKLIGTFGDSGDLRAGRSGMEAFRAVLRGPRPPITFSSPHSVSVGSSDRIAVADGLGGAVHIIDLKARTHLLVSGFGDQPLGVPLGVAWVGDRLFVTDAKLHEVIEFDSSGEFTGRFGSDLLTRPVGIAHSTTTNLLYVVDGGGHTIQMFDLAGKSVGAFGRRGSGPGEFNFPTHICCFGDRILVSDSGNFRVQLLDSSGNSLRTIGKKGDGAGDFALPKGVAFDRDGHIYVADARFENIQIFEDTGQLLLAFGREGSGLGQLSLPAGIAIDDSDRIWVADSGNRRLQVFAYMRTSS